MLAWDLGSHRFCLRTDSNSIHHYAPVLPILNLSESKRLPRLSCVNGEPAHTAAVQPAAWEREGKDACDITRT